MYGFFDDPYFSRYQPQPRRQYYPYQQQVYDPPFVSQQTRYAPRSDPLMDPFYSLRNLMSEDESYWRRQHEQDPYFDIPPRRPEMDFPQRNIPMQRSERNNDYEPFARSAMYSANSRGGIEEIREKTYDSRSHQTIESQTRRIGDRWVRIDTITDRDGHSFSKESWHNVENHEQEAFKAEWVQRRGIGKAAHAKALQAEKEPKEESKPEVKQDATVASNSADSQAIPETQPKSE